MSKLIKLPTPHGEMELLWSQELYQGFIPDQHGGTLLYNGDKYFTTLKSLSELESIIIKGATDQRPVSFSVEGGKKYTREVFNYLVDCHRNQTPVNIGNEYNFVISNVTYDPYKGFYQSDSHVSVEGFLV